MPMFFNMNQPMINYSTMELTRNSTLYFIKENMKSIGWTVLQCSDGVTHSLTSDIWTTLASIVTGSWILLESPAGIITGGTGKTYIVLAPSSNEASGVIKYHNVLPTGGDIIVQPTSPSQMMVCDNQPLISNTVALAHRLSFVGWSTGAFSFKCARAGAGITSMFEIYPITDISNAYPYATGAKFVGSGYGMVPIASHLDNVKIWNRDGTATSASGRIEFVGCCGNDNPTGAGIPYTGDDFGNQHHSEVTLYNKNVMNYERIGKLGGEGYNYGLTGATTIPNGAVDGIPTTKSYIGAVLFPANEAYLM